MKNSTTVVKNFEYDVTVTEAVESSEGDESSDDTDSGGPRLSDLERDDEDEI